MNPPFAPPQPPNQQWPHQSPQHVADQSYRVSSDLKEGFQPAATNSGNISELPVQPDSEDALEDALEDLDIPDIPTSRQQPMGKYQGLSGWEWKLLIAS